MKKKSKNTLARKVSIPVFAMAIALGIIHSPAHALFGGGGGLSIVYDPTNYAKNSITAIEQYMATANSYVQMAQDVKQTTRRVTDFAAGQVGLTSKEGQQLMQFLSTGKNLHGSLRNTQQVHENMQRVFSASKYTSWNDFVSSIGQRKEQGDRTAKTLYDSAVFAEDQLRKANDQHKKVAEEMHVIQGVTDAAIATTQSVGVVIQQNQGMLQLMSANSRSQGEELQRQATEREQEEIFKKKYFESAAQSLARDKAVMGIK